MILKHAIKLAPVFLAALALGGCANRTPQLYSWGPYESQVYSYFKNESPEKQILILEEHAKETLDSGQRLPPGYRAHLGLLYAKAGRDADFLTALQQEKAAFPESAAYVDSLLIKVVVRKEVRNEQK